MDQPDEIIRKRDVAKFVGLKPTQLDEAIKHDASFPKPIRITDAGRAVGFFRMCSPRHQSPNTSGNVTAQRRRPFTG
ncbi:MAG TPA: AlpA family phage regulatory protein [Methyloceanibacter sp.]|jgi:predicted DNA-binding transcriptional regulator AlpA|nr:AlpA family phage regulatory protein [Methyloceanibacter sp.]